jgi:GntR family transcriptional regulator
MSYFNEIYGDLELSARAKQVLVYLHDRANKGGESWYAIGTMAKDLSLSRSTIKRALAELVRQGRIKKVPGEWGIHLQLLSTALENGIRTIS